MKCIYCESDNVAEDYLEINDTDYPAYICDDCGMVWRRIEEDEK